LNSPLWRAVGYFPKLYLWAVISEMGSGAVAFADGMQQDSFPFPAGERLVIKSVGVVGKLVLPA
jgi:hypothetical protein